MEVGNPGACPRVPGAEDGKTRIPGFLFEWYLNFGYWDYLPLFGSGENLNLESKMCGLETQIAYCVNLGNLFDFPESLSSGVHLLTTLLCAGHCAGTEYALVNMIDKISAFLSAWACLPSFLLFGITGIILSSDMMKVQ